jgi:N4-gp56 family major capsid protein
MNMLYNDISPRTQARADRRLLTRATPNNILGQFGQVREQPTKSTLTVKFRRYNKLAVATTPLSEGVTPSGKTLTKTDLTVTLAQYGDYVTITDVIMDTHEDPVLQEATDILGEQAGETYDVLRFGVLRAGTNVLYANGTARSDVNTAVSKTLLRKAERVLMRQEAKTQTAAMKAGPNVGTTPIPPCYPVIVHADCKMDLEQLTDWVPVQEYPSGMGIINGEIGSSGMFRFIVDNNCVAWADGGGAKGSMISTGATYADVYPMLVLGKDAYGLVPLAGKNAVSTYVNNPKPSDTDPLAQRGTVGWKGYTATVILNDLWMLRLEVACTA